jgi:hypothetical protein
MLPQNRDVWEVDFLSFIIPFLGKVWKIKANISVKHSDFPALLEKLTKFSENSTFFFTSRKKSVIMIHVIKHDIVCQLSQNHSLQGVAGFRFIHKGELT